MVGARSCVFETQSSPVWVQGASPFSVLQRSRQIPSVFVKLTWNGNVKPMPIGPEAGPAVLVLQSDRRGARVES
jgi:hypothetical protein